VVAEGNDVIIARATEDQVVAKSTGEFVAALSAVDVVVAPLAVDGVFRITAGKLVVALSAVDQRGDVDGAEDDRVAAGAGLDRDRLHAAALVVGDGSVEVELKHVLARRVKDLFTEDDGVGV